MVSPQPGPVHAAQNEAQCHCCTAQFRLPWAEIVVALYACEGMSKTGELCAVQLAVVVVQLSSY